MNTDKGRLFYATGIDNSQLKSDAAESKNILSGIGKAAEQEGNRMDATFKKIAAAAGGVFAVGQVVNFAKKIIEVRGEIESLQISFETLAGKTKGDALFSQIRQFAVSTPMMMKDLAAGAQTMLAFNIEAEKVMPILRSIGDISMGDAQKFNSLTLAFSQMSATGKLMGQDLLQMINAGFNPLSVISEQTGKTIGELKEEMEKGKITTEMVTNAFMSASSAGGKFYGMLEKQSHGINGAISNLQGAIDDMYNDLGTASQGVIAGAIDGATNLVKNYETVAEILSVIVGTYGVYKGAVIANEALIQASISAKTMAVQNAYEAEIEALTALIPEKEAEAQSSLQQAVAAGQITEQKAAEIAAIRAEAEAQMESLAATEAAAKARLMASQEEIAVALKWEDEINNKISALEEEANALFENGDTIAFNAKQEEIAALKAELLEVQKTRETAVEAANTAATEMNAAAHQQSAIANAQNTAATEVNTAATGTNTAAQSALTVAKTKLIAIVKKLYAAISAHPYALAAAAVAALAYGIYKLVTYQTDAEKAQERLNDALSKSSASIAAETTKIDVMFNRLRRAKEGTEEYEKAKQNIINQYGNYLKGLDSEISSLQDVEAAYKAITEAVKESMRVKAMDKYIEDEGEEYSEKYSELYEKIKKTIAEKKGQAYADALSEEINDVMKGSKKFTKEFLSAWDKVWATHGYSGVSNELQDLVDEAVKAGSDFEKYIENARQKFGISKPGKTEEKTEDDSKKETRQDKAFWEKLKKDAEEELAALTYIEAKGKKGKELQNRISKYDEILKTAYGSGKSGGSNTGQQNADLLATEAANRKKQEEQYTKQLSDQAKDSEFEISQARIDAKKDGIDKELAQNKLNYKRLEEQNRRRLREMLDNLAEQKLRLMEDADPTVFKRKNSDGKWEEDPGKRDAVYTEIRANLTVADLTDTQQRQIKEFADIATKAYTKANEDSLKTMLEDVLTYEQQRQKIAEEYASKRNALYTTDMNGNKVLRSGVTQGNVDELNRQEQEAYNAVDEQFAQREETYQAWCNQIANMTLSQLEKVLQQAEKELNSLGDNADSKKLAIARAKVNTAKTAVTKANAQNDTNPGKRTIKEWEDLYKTLSDVEGEFESIGDTVGGTVGEIISQCGQFATSTLQMINGIVQLTNISKTGIEGTAIAGATAISTMEKASVILTIISAGMQIAMQIVSLFNNDDSKQKEIENLQDRIDQLQWELDHQEIGRVQKQYGDAINRLNQALAATKIEIASTQTGWDRIITLMSRASENQELMQKTAEKLAKTYGSMAYTADKALGAAKYQSAEESLKNIAQQQLLIQEQIELERSKKKKDKGQIEEWEQKIEELGQQALELINEMVEDIIGDTSTGIADELANAFIEAFQAGENAAEAWGNKVNEIVADVLKRMLVSKYLEEPLGQIFDKYKTKWFKDGQFQGLDAVINSMQSFADDLNAVGQDFATIWENLPESVKNMFTITSDAEREASQKGIASASQESVDELNGRATAIQSHTFSINENTKTILATTQAILRSVMNIETETTGFGSRLERIEGNIKEMNNTIGDMATRGIRLKN